MDWLIYTLKNPRTQEIRYVGFTTQSAEKRLGAHIRDSIRSARTHRQRWILSLLSIGLTPLIEVIENGSGAGWEQAEQRWIGLYRGNGARLVNATDGGEGFLGWGNPEDRKAKRQKQISNTTPEQRSAASKKGFASRTPEGRRAPGLKAAANRTAEQRSEAARKAALALKASTTPEQRSATAKAREAAQTQEQRSARIKKANESRTPEQRSNAAKKASAQFTHEQRSERSRKGNANKTPEQIRAFSMAGRQAPRTHVARMPFAVIPPEDMPGILADRQRGVILRDIAERYGISASSVCAAILREKRRMVV